MKGVVTLRVRGCNIGRWRCDLEGGRSILGDACEKTPGLEARSQLLAIERGTQQMALEREVLADGAEA